MKTIDYREYMTALERGEIVSKADEPLEDVILTNAPTPTMFRGVDGFVTVLRMVQESRRKP